MNTSMARTTNRVGVSDTPHRLHSDMQAATTRGTRRGDLRDRNRHRSRPAERSSVRRGHPPLQRPWSRTSPCPCRLCSGPGGDQIEPIPPLRHGLVVARVSVDARRSFNVSGMSLATIVGASDGPVKGFRTSKPLVPLPFSNLSSLPVTTALSCDALLHARTRAGARPHTQLPCDTLQKTGRAEGRPKQAEGRAAGLHPRRPPRDPRSLARAARCWTPPLRPLPCEPSRRCRRKAAAAAAASLPVTSIAHRHCSGKSCKDSSSFRVAPESHRKPGPQATSAVE